MKPRRLHLVLAALLIAAAANVPAQTPKAPKPPVVRPEKINPATAERIRQRQ